jgi:hypothetical protein
VIAHCFCSHRLPLAIAAKNAGYSVYVVTRVRSHGAEIEAAGLKLIPIEISRRSKNPFVEISTICRLTQIYKDIKPDIVHQVSVKPVMVWDSCSAPRSSWLVCYGPPSSFCSDYCLTMIAQR